MWYRVAGGASWRAQARGGAGLNRSPASIWDLVLKPWQDAHAPIRPPEPNNHDMDVGPYETIDFGKLADAFPPLKPFLFKNATGGYSLNFKDEVANRTLTRALLNRDFGLEVTLLEDRLCPPVPNRLNYVLWITEVVKVLSPEEPIIGLDIGTGSTAIYPLLTCSIHKTWRFIAADIDSRSLAGARANIEQNPGVKDRIYLYPTTQDAPILSPLLPENLSQIGIQHVTFSMCNPPFYSDMEEVNRSAEGKEYDPHAVCTGALVEMVTPGGEVAFVQRMIDESMGLRETCRWYTSLLGKMSSVTSLVNSIKDHGIDNYAITELVQGTTRRWVIAWSFMDTRLPDILARPKSSSLKSIAPPTQQPPSLIYTTHPLRIPRSGASRCAQTAVSRDERPATSSHNSV
ncbi:hypothetical protein OPQ81_005866 [Rhizoctonia solani]|nr:hypothetical protein OPQ81_005866 [Rhizoctonia solani]